MSQSHDGGQICMSPQALSYLVYLFAPVNIGIIRVLNFFTIFSRSSTILFVHFEVGYRSPLIDYQIWMSGTVSTCDGLNFGPFWSTHQGPKGQKPDSDLNRGIQGAYVGPRFLVVVSMIYGAIYNEGFTILGSTTGINRMYQNRERYKRFSESVTARDIKTKRQPCNI
jgi:hypothetical protein